MPAAPPQTDPWTLPPTPLEERLIALVHANGAMSVADYMSDALFHPNDGYYTSKSPIGARGDFTTAPEISQIFGELIGLWLVASWEAMGAPASFQLVELGPGRGVLMADILRAADVRPAFLNAASVNLVEISGRLRHEQQKRLKKAPAPVAWKDSFDDVDDGPCLIVANEFFDCLPVRQFVMTADGWRERMVSVATDDAGRDRLVFAPAFAPPLDAPPLPTADIAEGDVFETNDDAADAIDGIGARLAEQSGAALIIDYGHLKAGLGDTLQAVRNHAPWPPLAAPGVADLTAHVNFKTLVDGAFAAGAAAHGPISQGAFLARLGLETRVERLTRGQSQEVAATIRSGARRISAPSEMGEIFKVMGVTGGGAPTPPGFDD